MKHVERQTIRVHYKYAASVEEVFDAWLDPQKACKFLFATPNGQIVKTEIDARVGGSFLIVDQRDGVDIEHLGVYMEIDRPRHLIFLFRVPHYALESTRVRVGLIPLAVGCELTISHEGVSEEWAKSAAEGWKSILEALEAVLTETTTKPMVPSE